MIVRAMVLAAAVMVGAGAAHAQAPVDIKDPAITKKPTLAPRQTSYPEYPSAARRANQQGETRLRTCVELSGRARSTTMVSSSGYDALDKAALAWTSDVALFVPAEASGKPTAVCNYEFTYVWKTAGENPLQAATKGFLQFKDMKPSDRPVVTLPTELPPYPAKTMMPGAKGKVRMAFCIGPDGKLANFELKKLEPGPDFLEPTMKWFGAAKFEPGKANGIPVGVCGVELEYDWKLSN